MPVPKDGESVVTYTVKYSVRLKIRLALRNDNPAKCYSWTAGTDPPQYAWGVRNSHRCEFRVISRAVAEEVRRAII